MSQTEKKWRCIRYTAEEDEIIRTDWVNCVPVAEAAKKIQRTLGAVRQRILHLGLRRKRDMTGAVRWAPAHLTAKRGELGEQGFLNAAYAWRDEQREQFRRKMQQNRLEITAWAMQKIDELPLSRN
jgi:hypothetical protein